MPLPYPDILYHNNGIDPLVDSNEVKGGTRSPVANLTALYALAPLASRLKERATRVFVTAENAYYQLVDIANVGNATGWALESGGSGVALTSFVFKEVPSGTIDGVNRIFNLANVPIAGTEHIFLNIPQTLGQDYTILGAQITFVVGNAPEIGDNLFVTYLKP